MPKTPPESKKARIHPPPGPALQDSSLRPPPLSASSSSSGMPSQPQEQEPPPSLLKQLEEVPLLSFLSSHPHPSFILDLDNESLFSLWSNRSDSLLSGLDEDSAGPLLRELCARSERSGVDEQPWDAMDIDASSPARPTRSPPIIWYRRGPDSATEPFLPCISPLALTSSSSIIVLQLSPAPPQPLSNLPLSSLSLNEQTNALSPTGLSRYAPPSASFVQPLEPSSPLLTPTAAIRSDPLLGDMDDAPTPADDEAEMDDPGTELALADEYLVYTRRGSTSTAGIVGDADMHDDSQDLSSLYKVEDLLRDTDWASTSLGPREKWSESLVTMVGIVMDTQHESCLFWGPEFVLIYNKAYSRMITKKHPALFGKSASDGWREIWYGPGGLKPVADAALRGTPVFRTDDLLFFDRDVSRAPEETYHTWSWIGAKNRDDQIEGLLNASFETSQKVLAERRLNVLRTLAQSASLARTVSSFIGDAMNALALNPHDVPFALLYDTDGLVTALPVAPAKAAPLKKSSGSVHSESTASVKPSGFSVRFQLAGSLGVPPKHSSGPSSIIVHLTQADALRSTNDFFSSLPVIAADSLSVADDVSGAASGSGESSTTARSGNGSACPWPIAEALLAKKTLIVDCATLVQGFEQRSWTELPDTALVIPITYSEDSASSRQSVLIVGLNSRRPFDLQYQAWMRLLRLQISSNLSSVLSVETQLQRTEELKKIDRAKSTFFSNVSHELRTPLTLIAGPVQDMIAGERDEARKGMLTLVQRNVARLARLVDSLMDAAKASGGRLEGTFSPCNLGVVVQDLASLFRSAIEKGGMRYIVDCDVSKKWDKATYVDPDFLEKIVFNILSNGFKYSIEGTIEVFVRYEADKAVFGVKDTGVGIPKADLPHVVSRFYRVSMTGRSHEGAGIGLALVVDLCQAHGATLEVESTTAEESEDGTHGSTFRIVFPLGRSHLPSDRINETPDHSVHSASRTHALGIIDEAESWVTSEPDASSISASDSGNSTESSSLFLDNLLWTRDDLVLVVDDNADMRRYISAILSPFVSVVQAANGVEALEAAQRKQPDLILSDLMMPLLDGAGLVQALKASPTELASVPVILMTAKAGEDDRVSGLFLGAEEYLPKPFSSKELIARCHLQMQLGKRRIELERKFEAKSLELHLRAEDAEAKRQQAEFERRQQQSLVDFTSHELRTPINAILQNALLCKENLSQLHADLIQSVASNVGFAPSPATLTTLEEDIDSLDSIISMGESQRRIADDVLSLARISLATLEICLVDVPLMSTIRKTTSIFNSEAKMKGISLSLVFGDSLLSLAQVGKGIFKTDPVRLGQVVVNLLSNSLRFTATSPVREIEVCVDVRKEHPVDGTCSPPPPVARRVASPGPEEQEEPVYIYGSVKDTGPGLSQEEQAQLFTRFRQASPETHALYGGSGLGLFVCRSIVELMGGAIEVVSSPGQGCNFRFYVRGALARPPPMASPELPPVLERPSLSTITSDPSSIGSDQGAAPHHVLIVEDSEINRKILVRQLKKQGIGADIACDGQQALDRIIEAASRSFTYRVILLDVEMPVMNGLECVKRIRQMEASGQLPQRNLVFCITGNARQGQVDQARAAGMDDVIVKPYKIQDLLARLHEVGV